MQVSQLLVEGTSMTVEELRKILATKAGENLVYLTTNGTVSYPLVRVEDKIISNNVTLTQLMWGEHGKEEA